MDEVPESTIALPTRPPSLPPPAWLTSVSGTVYRSAPLYATHSSGRPGLTAPPRTRAPTSSSRQIEKTSGAPVFSRSASKSVAP